MPVILMGLAGWAAATSSVTVAILIGGGALLALVLAVHRIARWRAAAKQSEARFAAIFERAGISMWREDWTAAARAVMDLRRAGVTDIECYYASRPDELRALCAQVLVTDVNTFTVEETGAADKSAYLGPLDRLLPSTDQTFVQWLVAFGRGDRFFRSEAHVVRADGSEGDTLFTAMLPQDLDGFAEIIVTSLDVTAFKQAQTRFALADTELARASRITTVGALSASIAHEVNSPLAVIVANAEAALRWLRRSEPNVAEASAALDDVVAAATRARDVISRTRAYLGNASSLFAPVDPLQAARDANLLVEREMRVHAATVHIAAEGEIPLIAADPVQVQQVFVNLLLNAAQAMSDSVGRRDIVIALRHESAFVSVAVTDTGPGVAPERRARIFQPFHSTKLGGMGMGLAICRNLIDAHGGDIWIEAAPSGGAAFHFTLPISHA
ncbi:sensor histidine kinase [Methylobacterium sp. CM6241]